MNKRFTRREAAISVTGLLVTQNVKTFVIFVSVLATLAFWLPLSNSPRHGPSGSTITETYFGVLRYGTLRSVMKEPDFSVEWQLNVNRLVLSFAVTAIFWAVVYWFLRRANRHRIRTRADLH